MAAMTTATVRIVTTVADGDPVDNTIGTLAVPIRDGAIRLTELHRALGELLCEAGRYLLTEAAADEPAKD